MQIAEQSKAVYVLEIHTPVRKEQIKKVDRMSDNKSEENPRKKELIQKIVSKVCEEKKRIDPLDSIPDRANYYNQASRLVEYIFNKNWPMFSLARMSDECLIDWCAGWVVESGQPNSSRSRNLLGELDRPSMNQNYKPLCGPEQSAKELPQPRHIQENIKKVDQYLNSNCMLDQQEWIRTIISVINKVRNPIQIIESLIQLNWECLAGRLLKGIQYVKAYQISCADIQQIQNYILISWGMISEVLYYLCMNQSKKSIDWLISIRENYSKLHFFNALYVNDEGRKMYQELTLNKQGERVSIAGQALALQEELKAIFGEYNRIEQMLVDDIDENPDFFLNPKPLKYEKIEDYIHSGRGRIQLINDMEEKETATSSSYYEKLKMARNYLEQYYEADSAEEKESARVLRIVYREIFVNKVKQSRRKNDNTSYLIAKKQMCNEEISSREKIFIEFKLQRGKFREAGRLDEYKLFTQIQQEYRDVLVRIPECHSYEAMIFAVRNAGDLALKMILAEIGK